MARQLTSNTGAASIDLRLVRKLEASFSGDLVLPRDQIYGRLRRVANHAVNRHPAIIARCRNRKDVQLAIDFARSQDLLTAVRSGGHSFAGYGVCEAGLVVDLSLMKRVHVDPLNKRVVVEPGIVAGELDGLTQPFRMAVPLGSCSSVGVAGYSLGGGESSLTPMFGYACDNIVAIELVTADSRILTAEKRQNAELFWAMRGAGANFGIATSLEFQLHSVEKVLAGNLRYSMRRAKKILAFLDSFAPTVPDELFLCAAVLPHPGERMLDVKVIWVGDEEEGERVLRPLRTYLKPFQDTIKPKAFLDEQRSAFDVPEGERSSCRRGGHFERLTADVIDVITEYASNSPHEASGITMMYWHGPWSSEPQDNAFGFRRTGFEYWVHTYWQKAIERRKSVSWVEAFFKAMEPLSTGAVYVNTLEDEGPDRARAAYGDKYLRLARTKRIYDADNFFRVNQNIQPAAA